MIMNYRPECAATIIGSFPHPGADEACRLVFRSLKDVPAWPQLPRRSFLEEMNNQYSSRLPCFYIDEENRKSGFNTGGDLAGELERFYTKIIEDDVEYFGIDEQHAAGFHCFMAGVPAGTAAVKGQVTGPLTLGLMTDFIDGKYALYKPDLFDAIVKNCVMAARWQVQRLKPLADRVIIFFDEPSLSIIGSGFYSVDRGLVMESFREIIRAIQGAGGLAGTHCCGNADWDELLQLELDIINFDATDEVIVDKFVNARNLPPYLERGSCIAWGIVPTIRDKCEAASSDAVEGAFRCAVGRLAGRGIREDDILGQSLLTPSCGTGALTVPLSEKVMAILCGLTDAVRKSGR
jgi:hypothetical protein